MFARAVAMFCRAIGRAAPRIRRPGQRVLLHNGPGTPLEPATLLRLDRKPHPQDPLMIEVWSVVYDNDPAREQVRALPCVCPACLRR